MFEVFTANTITDKETENTNRNLQRTFGACIKSKKTVFIYLSKYITKERLFISALKIFRFEIIIIIIKISKLVNRSASG